MAIRLVRSAELHSEFVETTQRTDNIHKNEASSFGKA